jgi:chaperonin cofactor prefoldin
MSENPLHVLRKGLVKLHDSIKGRKDNLLACLNRKEKISDEDEQWLDNAGNLVDEEIVVDLLDNASDYEHGLTRLTSQQKALVEKLKELGEVNKAMLPGKKRKHTCCHICL